MMTLEQMVEAARRGATVKWSDGRVTKLTYYDTHVLGIMIVMDLDTPKAEALAVKAAYECEVVP